MSSNSRRHHKEYRHTLTLERKAREAVRVRVGGPVLDRLEVGVLYRLREAIETRCYCGDVLDPGDFVVIDKFISPNRVQVVHGHALYADRADRPARERINGSVHKIRASSLRARAVLVGEP